MLEDWPFHLTHRGNHRKCVFRTDDDRRAYLRLLDRYARKFGMLIWAYCLMGNHVHLAVQVGDVPLSKSMQNLSFRYTRWINQRQQRSGHLFQGRYHAILVDKDSYLLELVRYIHLNPAKGVRL